MPKSSDTTILWLLFLSLFVSILRWNSNFTAQNQISRSEAEDLVVASSPNGTKWKRETIPLLRLADSFNSDRECPSNFVYMKDTHVPNTDNTTTTRKIPNIVHMTGKSRCMTSGLAANVNRWRFDNYSFYFHDDKAVDRLFNKEWVEFPHLQQVLHCVRTKSSKASVWRYLVLWEYGGVYADLDTVPESVDGNTVLPNADAVFLADEKGKLLSQEFMALSPRHPLVYFAVVRALNRVMMDSYSVERLDLEEATGSFALNRGLQLFLHNTKYDPKQLQKPISKWIGWIPPLPKEGMLEYHGFLNRSITVLSRTDEKGGQRVRKDSLEVQKQIEEYHKMGMEHVSEEEKHFSWMNFSCPMEMLSRYAALEREGLERTWRQ